MRCFFTRSSCRPCIDWLCFVPIQTWASDWPETGTGRPVRSQSAKNWICSQRNGSCLSRRCTRWTASCGSPPNNFRDSTATGRLPLRPLRCAVRKKRCHLFILLRNKEDAQIEAYHSKAVACPQCAPISRTSRNVVSLTVNRNHIGGNVTHDTPATTTNINI